MIEYLEVEQLPGLPESAKELLLRGTYSLYKAQSAWIPDVRYVLLAYKPTCGCGHSDLPPRLFLLSEDGATVVRGEGIDYDMGERVYLSRSKIPADIRTMLQGIVRGPRNS